MGKHLQNISVFINLCRKKYIEYLLINIFDKLLLLRYPLNKCSRLSFPHVFSGNPSLKSGKNLDPGSKAYRDDSKWCFLSWYRNNNDKFSGKITKYINEKRYIRIFSVSLIFYLSLVLIAICFLTCKKPFENPFDPNSNDYQKPRIVYLSLLDSTVLTSDTLIVTWQANHPLYCEYAYRLQENEEWSPWTLDTMLMERLADSEYNFQITVRYRGLIDTTITTVHFNVNTLTGSAMYLYPLRQTVSLSAPTTSFYLNCKNLNTCNALEIIMRGVTVNNAQLVDPSATNSFVFTHDSIITVGIGPNDLPIANTMSFLNIEVTPLATTDTTEVGLFITSAKLVNDSIQQIVPLDNVKGGFIVKE